MLSYIFMLLKDVVLISEGEAINRAALRLCFEGWMGTKAHRVDAAYQDLRAVLDKKVTWQKHTCMVTHVLYVILNVTSCRNKGAKRNQTVTVVSRRQRLTWRARARWGKRIPRFPWESWPQRWVWTKLEEICNFWCLQTRPGQSHELIKNKGIKLGETCGGVPWSWRVLRDPEDTKLQVQAVKVWLKQCCICGCRCEGSLWEHG